MGAERLLHNNNYSLRYELHESLAAIVEQLVYMHNASVLQYNARVLETVNREVPDQTSEPLRALVTTPLITLLTDPFLDETALVQIGFVPLNALEFQGQGVPTYDPDEWFRLVPHQETAFRDYAEIAFRKTSQHIWIAHGGETRLLMSDVCLGDVYDTKKLKRKNCLDVNAVYARLRLVADGSGV